MRQATKMIDLFRINPDATLAASCLLAITILLTIDVISYLGQYQDRFLNYPLLGIMLGLLFVGFGRRITKLAFDPSKGLTLEQELRRFDDLTRMIDRVRDHASVENVTALLARVNAEEDVWSRLMIFRLILRHLLRSACLSLQRRDQETLPPSKPCLTDSGKKGISPMSCMKEPRIWAGGLIMQSGGQASVSMIARCRVSWPERR
jgi:hypothetical protein